MSFMILFIDKLSNEFEVSSSFVAYLARPIMYDEPARLHLDRVYKRAPGVQNRSAKSGDAKNDNHLNLDI